MKEKEFMELLLDLSKNTDMYASEPALFPKALQRIQDGYDDDMMYSAEHDHFFFGADCWNGKLGPADAELLVKAGIDPDSQNGTGFYFQT